MQPATYMTIVEDEWVQSLSTGAFKKFVLTPSESWGLGLNLSECSLALRIKNPDATFGCQLFIEYSADGKTWTASAAAVITEKSAAGDYFGVHSTNTEIMPFYRVTAQVRDTAVAAVKAGQITVWQYMKYRT